MYLQVGREEDRRSATARETTRVARRLCKPCVQRPVRHRVSASPFFSIEASAWLIGRLKAVARPLGRVPLRHVRQQRIQCMQHDQRAAMVTWSRPLVLALTSNTCAGTTSWRQVFAARRSWSLLCSANDSFSTNRGHCPAGKLRVERPCTSPLVQRRIADNPRAPCSAGTLPPLHVDTPMASGIPRSARILDGPIGRHLKHAALGGPQ